MEGSGHGASGAAGGTPVVLAVDDDVEIRRTYERWLEDDWEVRLAADGQAALARADDDVDVVLLDRMMPGMSGEEVLASIRERDLDCRVVMVTAVNPDLDILEMPFDAYVSKPVDREELEETVARLLARGTHERRLQRYYSLVEKQATLRAEKPDERLAGSERYRRLVSEIETLEQDLRADIAELDQKEFVAFVDDIV